MKSLQVDIECIVCNKTLQKINHNIPREFNMRKISRRSRTPNWSSEEKQYLLDLIKERKEIVVNKPNAPNNYEEKDFAWNEILHELTTKFGTKFNEFSVKKLKTQWQNMKRIAREEISLNGPVMEKYTRQSFEVCNILDLVKNGELKQDKNIQFEPVLKTDIEIKTECIDDESNTPSCSGINVTQATDDVINMDSSSVSESMDLNDTTNENCQTRNHKTVETMTDFSIEINSFPRASHDFLRFSTTEKEIKMEALKEEMQIIRSMRETAELNKIIAEQKLKHVLWVQKQEMAMYSGEPGSGAGRGGGAGGSIREAGGSFGKMEAAREDEYFYKKQKEQLANIKGHMEKEIAFHQEQIKRHEDAIRRHKQTLNDMGNKK